MKQLSFSIVCVLMSQFIVAVTHRLEIPESLKKEMNAFYRDKHVLVTGGCGFIGSHVCERLVSCGALVTIVDNLSTGSLANVEPFLEKLTIHTKDITDMVSCVEATKGQDVIFHLAAFISVPLSLENPELCYRVNVDGLFNLLESARINRVPRFVFSSSAAVYGPTEECCSEATHTNPISPYGFSKLIGEYLCKQYAINFGIDAVMLRYFNVYGPRQNPQGPYAAVVARFVTQIIENKPITIFGDGLQTRDFVSVEQVVEANLLMGMLERTRVRGEIFNVATGKSITLLELVEDLRKKFPHSTSKVTFGPERSSSEVRHTGAHIDKFREVLMP